MIRFWLRETGTKDFESLFLSNLQIIERIARSVSRRHGFGSDELDDFCSHVKTKFLDNDYSVLKKFQGRCSLPLYIKTVIHRLCIDYEIARKGKWRPSGTAQKLGSLAVQLEELLYKKHHSFDEACQILSSRQGVDLQPEMLHQLAQKLPKRWGKTTVRLVPIDAVGGPGLITSTEAPDPKMEESVQILSQVLRDFIQGLSGADRLILKMRFEDDFTFEEIARLLKKKKLQIYWRLRKILSDLQKELQSRSLSRDRIREITEHSVKTIDVDFLNETQQSQECPSKQEGT